MRKLQVALLVVGVGALVWMVFQLGPERLLAGMRDVGWGFALTCSAHLCGLLFDAVVLRACAGAPGSQVPYLHFARTVIAGHGVNAATPFGKVGELVKYSLLEERLRKADAAAALVAQNIASFVVNCGLIALVTPLTLVFFDVAPAFTVAFAVVGIGFLGAGAVGLVILRRGVGGWPFAVMRRVGFGRFRLSRERLDRWRKNWSKVEKSWKAATSRPGTMLTVWAATVASRLCNVVEAGLLIYFLGGEQVVAAAFINLAGYQFTGWLFTFLPIQVGTAEGAAYIMFKAVGLSPSLGVMVEIGRKLRSVVFLFLGITVLGWDTFRRLTSGDSGKRAGDDDENGKSDEPHEAGDAAR